MSRYDDAIAFARKNRERSLQSLTELLRIPSVSTLPEHIPDMQRAAEWLVQRLQALGFDGARILPTARHPVVYAEWMKAGPSAQTILFYGHYDVQPTDPIGLWRTDPFDPVVEGDNLYARGASDMKGQVMAHLSAVEAILHTGDLPVNLKIMLEGEEEIGSPSLPAFIQQNQALLKSDFCLNGDSGILAADTPALTLALRGLAYFEITVQGPSTDMHSGGFGGAVDNPALVLCQVIAGMRDAQGVIQLPGFYDAVRPLSARDRQEMAKLPTDEAWWLAQTGAPQLAGEAGLQFDRARQRPPHTGRQRTAERLHRRGLEDRSTGQGHGQGVDALGARPGSSGHTRFLGDLPAPAHASDGDLGDHRTRQLPSLGHRHGLGAGRGRRARTAQRVGQSPAVCAHRRFGARCRPHQGTAGSGQYDARVRAPG